MIVYEEPHARYYRHYIDVPEISEEILIIILKEKLNPSVINGIKIPEKFLPTLQNVFKNHFSKYKIRITQKVVEDVTLEERKFAIIEREHRRAHRNATENRLQILEKYYFPKMSSLIKNFIKTCEICNSSKYDRRPNKPEFQPTPIPKFPTQILHMDLMEIQGEKYITCIDKLSKFVKFFHIKDRSALHLRNKLTKILHYFTVPEMIVIDNERSFMSPIILNYIKTLGITIYNTPSQKSEVNGTIERVHSTIIELVRCLNKEYQELSQKEIIYLAVDRYNNTIHSVIKAKPSDIFFGRSSKTDYQNLIAARTKVDNELSERIRENQQTRLSRENKEKDTPKPYKTGQTIYVRDKQIKAKHKPIYKKEVVLRNNRVTITTASGKKIHKSHIKNISE